MSKKNSACGPIAYLCRAVLDFCGNNFEDNFAVKKAYVRLKSNSGALALILKPKTQTVLGKIQPSQLRTNQIPNESKLV